MVTSLSVAKWLHEIVMKCTGVFCDDFFSECGVKEEFQQFNQSLEKLNETEKPH